MASSHAPTNPPSPPTKAAPNLTSAPAPSDAPTAPKSPSASSSSPATTAAPPPHMPSSTPSTATAPPAPTIKLRFRPLYGPPPAPPTHESAPPPPPSTFTFINATPRSLRGTSGPPTQPSTSSAPPTTWNPINPQQHSSNGPPPSAPPTTPSAPAPAPAKRPRHAWTPAELNILTCLRLHTPLGYDAISAHMSTLLRAPRVGAELLRYKANQLRGVMPPSQAARKSQPGRVDARWRYFAGLTARAVVVQKVLRGCGRRELWAGQAAEDALAVLVLYGGLGDGEVARRVSERFGVECSEEMVGFWRGVNVGGREGSWAWFQGKGAGDGEVRAVLEAFGL